VINKIIIINILIIFSSFVFGEQITQKFDAEKIKKININTSKGKVVLSSVTDKISLVITDKIKVSKECQIIVELQDNVLNAKTQSRGGDCEVNFNIAVPANVKLDVNIGSGDLEISYVHGNIHFKIGKGDVVINSPGHKVNGKIGSGTIKINYKMLPEKGVLDISSGRGETSVTLPEGSKITSNLKVGLGSIQNEIGEFENASFKINIKSGWGDIKITKIKL